MKRFLPVSLLLLAGCGFSPAPAPKTVQSANARRMPAPVPNPAVLLVGDSIVNAWCSAGFLAQNPTWACQGTPAGIGEETTAEVLARFPAAISVNPKTIVIEAGVWDMEAYALSEPLDYTGSSPNPCEENNPVSPPPSPTPCANIQAMVTEATNAGIKVILCTIPPWGIGPAAISFPDELQNHIADILYLNQAILADAAPGVTAVDMYSLLSTWQPGEYGDVDYFDYWPDYTDDGVGPNTLGGQVMTQALQTAVAAENTNQAEKR
jgi:hypothetical protein